MVCVKDKREKIEVVVVAIPAAQSSPVGAPPSTGAGLLLQEVNAFSSVQPNGAVATFDESKSHFKFESTPILFASWMSLDNSKPLFSSSFLSLFTLLKSKSMSSFEDETLGASALALKAVFKSQFTSWIALSSLNFTLVLSPLSVCTASISSGILWPSGGGGSGSKSQ